MDKEPDFVPVAADNLITDFTYSAINSRGIPLETARRYGYAVGEFKGQTVQIANWYDDAGNIVGQKIRTPDKKFLTFGTVEGLYGKHRMRDSGKMIVVTEGELDCLAVATAFDNKWPVVSLPHGAGPNAKKWIKRDLEWLERFDRVVLAFDADSAGAAAAEECRTLFTPGKCRIAKFSHKDPCEYLQAGERAALVDAIWSAPVWTPAGIISGAQILDVVLNSKVSRLECGWPWAPLNDLCSGIRLRELITITAGTGIGKSTFCRELAAHFLNNNIKVGYLALEESPRTTALGIFSVFANRNLIVDYTPDVSLLHGAHKAWGENLFLYDHFGSTATDELLSRVRYLIVGFGCRVIVLDHLSIVVSGLEIDDERKAIDVMMTKLRTLVEETGVLLFVVSHLRRPQGKGHEEGEAVSMSHLRGSAAIGQLSDLVIGLERNQQDEEEAERHRVAVRVLKNRFSGKTGVAGVLSYDSETGRLTHTINTDF